jgi:hypothetical protein
MLRVGRIFSAHHGLLRLVRLVRLWLRFGLVRHWRILVIGPLSPPATKTKVYKNAHNGGNDNDSSYDTASNCANGSGMLRGGSWWWRRARRARGRDWSGCGRSTTLHVEHGTPSSSIGLTLESGLDVSESRGLNRPTREAGCVPFRERKGITRRCRSVRTIGSVGIKADPGQFVERELGRTHHSRVWASCLHSSLHREVPP